MTSTNQLEFKGKIERHPVDELLLEFSQKGLTGSVRLSSGEKKAVVYFAEGNVVYAVSNERCHRLFEILLQQGQLEKPQLVKIEEFTNDMHLAKTLVDDGSFSENAMDSVFVAQITAILNDALKWTMGEFEFSASARIKSDIHFDVDLATLLEKHVHAQDTEKLLRRVGSSDEKFGLVDNVDLTSAILNPQDAFILSRLATEPISADTLQAMCGFPLTKILPTLYRLWMSGFVTRWNWHSAISAEDTTKISKAKFELKTSAKSFEEELEKAALIAAEIKDKEAKAAEEAEKTTKAKEEMTLEKYLETIENAATHYEILDISPDSKLSSIKKAYFSLAKRFHPDLFYNIDEKTHERVQNAFTEIAQAYETLKSDESREVYDFKLRKVIEKLRESESGADSELTKDDFCSNEHAAMAEDNFETGYDYLLNDNIKMALPHLGRAVHIESNNARYHAFYGRALSFDPDSHRKAEAEYQQALKLEPKNTHYRFMLAELLVDIGHKVRARGELTRLLKLDPKHKEAQHLLDTLSD